MENEFMKRGYLLPAGCKDLSDVAKLKLKQMPEGLPLFLAQKLTASKEAAPLPPITRQVFISPPMTVKKLAALLGQKPFRIIRDLGQLGVSAGVYSIIDFKAVSAVAKMHGFQAIKGA